MPRGVTNITGKHTKNKKVSWNKLICTQIKRSRQNQPVSRWYNVGSSSASHILMLGHSSLFASGYDTQGIHIAAMWSHLCQNKEALNRRHRLMVCVQHMALTQGTSVRITCETEHRSFPVFLWTSITAAELECYITLWYITLICWPLNPHLWVSFCAPLRYRLISTANI